MMNTKVPSNIAQGCPCRQSSINEREQPDPDGANAAVNGRKTGGAAFTTQREDAPWWQVDLGQMVDLDSIVVYNWDVTDLPYSAAGRSRARFLQVWGSADAHDWQLLHERTGQSDFGGIHNAPLCVPLAPAQYRHLKLGLAGGGILQLDQVQVYAVRERSLDEALRELMQCASELSYAMARRIVTALALAPAELPGHVQRLDIRLDTFSAMFVATLLVEHHQGEAARALLETARQVLPASAATAPPAADAPPLLSLHLPPYRLAAHDGQPQAILQGQQALLLQDGAFADPAALLQAVATLFARHPRLERITASRFMDDWTASVPGASSATGHAYRLDLPASVKEYQLSYLSPDVLAGIAQQEPDAAAPETSLGITDAASLADAAFAQAVLAAAASAPERTPEEWTALRPRLRLARLHSGAEVLASTLYLDLAPHCHLFACGERSATAARQLQWRLIGALIEQGMRHVHLHGPDSVSHTLFGAIEQAHYTLTFKRTDGGAMAERVQAALAGGQTPGQIEADAAASLETLLGRDFEAVLQVDFDAIVENAALGTDSHARRYQPTIRDAFFMMMQHIPFDPDEVFVDVGSGKGKMLYYAYQLGYKKCVGMEISLMLQEQAKINFERLQLPVDIRLWERDARNLDLDELAGLSLFYLANPFGPEIMDGFLRCLVASQQANPRILRVVYCVAMAEAPFATWGFRPAQVFEQGVDGWRFPHSVIYQRDPP